MCHERPSTPPGEKNKQTKAKQSLNYSPKPKCQHVMRDIYINALPVLLCEPLELTPHALEPELDVLQPLVRRLPLVEHAQQPIDLRSELLLDNFLLEKTAHRPGQEVRILTCRAPAALVFLHSQLVCIPRVVLCPRYWYVNPAKGCCDVGLGLLRGYREGRGFERMLDGEGVHARVFIDARVAFAAVDGTCEVRGEFADEAVVRQAEVSELEDESDEVGEE